MLSQSVINFVFFVFLAANLTVALSANDDDSGDEVDFVLDEIAKAQVLS